MEKTYIKEFVPCSWFHPKGIFKVLKRIWPRLPNVAGCLFVTFTIDRAAMRAKGYGPGEAFDETRQRIRKIYYKLRKGVHWKGKFYQIKAPYCVKVEFHADEEGWPHFHVIWLTRRYVPAELVAALWGYGRTNVKRIQNDDFHYLLKYVCKGMDLPEWVKDRNRLRIFQSSRGFLAPDPKAKPDKAPDENPEPRLQRTIGERVTAWQRSGLLVTEDHAGNIISAREISLRDTFRNLFDHLVYAVALAGRYLGDGKIQLIQRKDIIPWIQNPSLNPPHPA